MKCKSLLATVIFLALAQSSLAADDTGYVGGMLGAAIPTGDANAGASTRLAYGLDAGYFVTPEIGIGAYGMRNSGGIANSALTLTTTFYGVEASYFWDSGLNLGVRGGLTSVSTSINGISVNSSPFSAGPRLGYELPLDNSFSLGAEYNPMFVFSRSTNNTNGVSSTTNAFTVHNIYLTLRYRF